MINKDDALDNNIPIIDRNEAPLSEKETLFQKLKEILPNVINSDNILNIQALQDVIDLSETTANNRGYELTFAGKGIAKAKADIPTTKELQIDEKQSKDFDNTNNILISGDNLDVLKILKQNYSEKIKCIYIDPPYNTESDGFIYNDNFKESEENLIKEFGLKEETISYLTDIYKTKTHSGWLAFMLPRLKLARELLTEDGVIFISIDDKEQANLKILCDEIFGADNFVISFPRLTKKAGKTSNLVSKNHDYLLCYVKSPAAEFERLIYETNSYDLEDEYLESRGFYKLSQTLDYNSISYSASLDYEIEINGQIFRPGNSTAEEMLARQKRNPKNDWCWRWSKPLLEFGLDKGFIVIKESKNGSRIYTKTYEGCTIKKVDEDYIIVDIARTKSLASIDFLDNKYSNDNARKDIAKLLPKDIFNYPKPTNLIKTIAQIATNSDDIILDFFAGSGTTGEAVMRLNAEDGGNRKFILVQLDEKIDETKPAYQFCKDNGLEPVISSITIERIKRAGTKILEEREKDPSLFEGKTLDTGLKVFSLTNKREIVKENEVYTIANMGVLSAKDRLFNLISASCQPLDVAIEEIEKDILYKANNNYYLLGTPAGDLSEYKDSYIYVDAYANIDLTAFLNITVANKENIKLIY